VILIRKQRVPNYSSTSDMNEPLPSKQQCIDFIRKYTAEHGDPPAAVAIFEAGRASAETVRAIVGDWTQSPDPRDWAMAFCEMSKDQGHDLDPRVMFTWFQGAMSVRTSAERQPGTTAALEQTYENGKADGFLEREELRAEIERLRREVARGVDQIRGLVNHWNEFGPADGFDEHMHWAGKFLERPRTAHETNAVPCASCAKHEKEMEQELEERDRNADYADQLTDMIGIYFETDHGEHSNLNDPWENAIETMRVAIGTKQSQEKTAETAACTEDPIELLTIARAELPDPDFEPSEDREIRLRSIRDRIDAYLRAAEKTIAHRDPTGTTREPPHCPSCSCGMADRHHGGTTVEEREAPKFRIGDCVLYAKRRKGVVQGPSGERDVIVSWRDGGKSIVPGHQLERRECDESDMPPANGNEVQK
jgi:hypothetical protein